MEKTLEIFTNGSNGLNINLARQNLNYDKSALGYELSFKAMGPSYHRVIFYYGTRTYEPIGLEKF